ncbi:DUF4406 domain-containing protein [Acidovorax sp. NCPPB 4044]|uniref:DUF4406 domain-containing protein n=1 Tax=Acidovorax sp. NCPPB 4044 TaxID=2940490 RepID=UPI00230361F1|nr:DUF4406 domain-containing protein [Acidovorax sp. NCPPB 4044]MDA8522023.1 DUF4406 domain-containing protein [Acidovorax sp. NCPPB 4044]
MTENTTTTAAPAATRPEALRLAEWLDGARPWPSYVPQEAAAELRRLHALTSAAAQEAEPAAPAPVEGTVAGGESHAEAMERERDYYRQRVRTLDEHQEGQVWYWQDDGGDHLESMVGSLPVVIRADQLRALLAVARRPQVAAVAVPEGWRLVPAEVKDEMLAAFARAADGALDWARISEEARQKVRDSFGPAYRAMLAAAPQAPAAPTAAAAIPGPPRAYAGRERGAWEHGLRTGMAAAQAPAAAVAPAEAVERIVHLRADRARCIYVAGPMTGLPEYNFPAFNAAAAKLRSEGWHVENPAEHGHVEGAGWADYLRWDISRVATCGAVYLLPGWPASKGACLEVHIAKTLGLRLVLAEGAEDPATPAPAAGAAPSLDDLTELVRWGAAAPAQEADAARLDLLASAPSGTIRIDFDAVPIYVHWEHGMADIREGIDKVLAARDAARARQEGAQHER